MANDRSACFGFTQGSCTPCTPVDNERFTADGGITDSCPSTPWCPLGEYLSSGSCRPCTNVAADSYYTDHGSFSDACPTATCASLACEGVGIRVDCGGKSEGYCTTCDIANLTEGQYFVPAAFADSPFPPPFGIPPGPDMGGPFGFKSPVGHAHGVGEQPRNGPPWPVLS